MTSRQHLCPFSPTLFFKWLVKKSTFQLNACSWPITNYRQCCVLLKFWITDNKCIFLGFNYFACRRVSKKRFVFFFKQFKQIVLPTEWNALTDCDLSLVIKKKQITTILSMLYVTYKICSSVTTNVCFCLHLGKSRTTDTLTTEGRCF